MLYFTFKILHILTATLLLTSVGVGCYQWYLSKNKYLLQIQTWTRIIPLALFQLLSGFTMISLKQYSLSEIWIEASLISFLIAIGSWFSFLYFIRAQTFFLIVCGSAVLSMIFFMASMVH